MLGKINEKESKIFAQILSGCTMHMYVLTYFAALTLARRGTRT